VNPEEIRRRLREAVARLEEIRSLDGDALTDEVRTEATGLVDTARGLQTELNNALAAENVIDGFRSAERTTRGRASANDAVAAQREEDRAESREETRSAGTIFTESDEFRAWAERRRSGEVFSYTFEGEESRAIVNSAVLPADYLQAQRLSGFDRLAPLYGSLRDVLAVGQTTAESIIYFKENAFTNAAAFVAEATATTGSSGLKPESGLSFTQATAEVGTIAHWMAVTEQLTWRAPEIRSIVDQRLLEGLDLVEDEMLLTGDGVAPNPEGLLETTGIQTLDNAYFTTSPTQNAGTEAEPFDRLARAKRLVIDVARSRPNFIIFNPEDDEYFQTIMDANGHYYGGGPYVSGVATQFWGLRRIVNEHMPQGQALVGDGRQAQIWDRMSARVEVGLVNDQFIRNMRTVRAEKSVGLAVYRPAAFALVDLFAA
jgi:HK97 family phage major capsid protein